jgi:hypothetical protein
LAYRERERSPDGQIRIAAELTVGPGDGYIGFWKTVKYYRQKIAGIERALRDDKLSPMTRRELKADARYYAEQVTMIYGKVIGLEKAKLQSITLKGDPDNPLQMNLNMDLDLSVLSEEELAVLARILPKLGSASGPASAAQDVLPEGGRGEATSSRKPRARRDRYPGPRGQLLPHADPDVLRPPQVPRQRGWDGH